MNLVGPSLLGLARNNASDKAESGRSLRPLDASSRAQAYEELDVLVELWGKALKKAEFSTGKI